MEELGGGRDALLLLHGGPGFDHTYLRPWLDPLAASFRLIYLDLRGHGRSRREAADSFRTDTVVADLEGLRAALGYDQWLLLGHSFGGFMALSYAVAHPDRLRALVLVTTAADIWSLLGYAARRLREAGGEELADAWRTVSVDDAAFWAARRRTLPYMFAQPDAPRAAAVFAGVRPAGAPNAFWFKRQAAHYDLRVRLPELAVPLLVIAGRQDRFMPMAASEALARALPRGRLQVFERSGHLPFVEEQAEFLESVREHLQAAK